MSLLLSSRVASYPKLPYQKIAEAILGKQYTLSLTFIGEKRGYTLNKTHRQGDYVPNVLSFPLSKHTGEIYIVPQVARRECKKFSMSYEGFVGYLFIHGLLHLKGYHHGDTMEKAEKKYQTAFKLK